MQAVDFNSAMAQQKGPEALLLQNQRMGEVLEGVKAPNGKILSGVIAKGWGSIAKVSVDQESGDIGNIERVETPEDT